MLVPRSATRWSGNPLLWDRVLSEGQSLLFPLKPAPPHPGQTAPSWEPLPNEASAQSEGQRAGSGTRGRAPGGEKPPSSRMEEPAPVLDPNGCFCSSGWHCEAAPSRWPKVGPNGSSDGSQKVTFTARLPGAAATRRRCPALLRPTPAHLVGRQQPSSFSDGPSSSTAFLLPTRAGQLFQLGL